MVKYEPGRLDVVFSALADATRRAVLARLRDGECSVGELAQPFGMSLPGFIKHVGVLEDAGLITRRKTGRVVTCTLQGGAAKAALDWLAQHEAFWNTRLDRLGAYLERKENDAWKLPSTTLPPSESAASSAPPSPRSTRRGPIRRK